MRLLYVAAAVFMIGTAAIFVGFYFFWEIDIVNVMIITVGSIVTFEVVMLILCRREEKMNAGGGP